MRHHTTPPEYRRLVGKLIQVYLEGWRVQRIISVKAGKRMGVRAIRVSGPSYEGLREDGRDRWAWNGPRHTFRLDDRSVIVAGIMYRNRAVPVADYLAMTGGAK